MKNKKDKSSDALKKLEGHYNLSSGFFEQFKDKEDFQNFFQSMLQQGIQSMLRAELDEHLGYEKHSTKGYNSGNSRN